jgi:hypothetical protein
LVGIPGPMSTHSLTAGIELTRIMRESDLAPE